ncbi:MAG: polysaccharide lyase, partial [Myxococcales bacterium]
MKRLIVTALAALTLLPASAMAEVVFRGDFETGDLTQWSKMQIVSPDRLQVVGSPAREGNFAMRTEVRQGDDPISSSGNRNEILLLTDEPQNSEYFYGWSTMFAEDFPSEPTWQLFTQWHHRGSSGSPPLEMLVNGEQMRLRVGGSGGPVVWTAPLVRGKWQDFVLHVKWAPERNGGFVELYHNGQLVLPRTPASTQFPGQTNYLKIGLYRNANVKAKGVVFHDRFTMGTTLEDVWIEPLEGPITNADVQEEA